MKILFKEKYHNIYKIKSKFTLHVKQYSPRAIEIAKKLQGINIDFLIIEGTVAGRQEVKQVVDHDSKKKLELTTLLENTGFSKAEITQNARQLFQILFARAYKKLGNTIDLTSEKRTTNITRLKLGTESTVYLALEIKKAKDRELLREIAEIIFGK